MPQVIEGYGGNTAGCSVRYVYFSARLSGFPVCSGRGAATYPGGFWVCRPSGWAGTVRCWDRDTDRAFVWSDEGRDGPGEWVSLLGQSRLGFGLHPTDDFHVLARSIY